MSENSRRDPAAALARARIPLHVTDHRAPVSKAIGGQCEKQDNAYKATRRAPPCGTEFRCLMAGSASETSDETGVVMSVLGDVFDSLKTTSLPELLFAFVACTGYMLAQGRLLAGRARALSAGVSLLATVGFVLVSATWAHSTMLVAFAMAGLGAFVALAWMCAWLLGLGAADPPPAAQPLRDDANVAPEPVGAASVAATPARVQRAPIASA
jgi:hypothetical protein